MENTYIDIGAKRIQTWLSKPVKLKYIRGGSFLLQNETSQATIQKWLQDEGFVEFEIADEAGDIDGVVVLKNSGAQTITDERADEVARKLLLHLNDKLPGVEWSGWRCRAHTFLESYQLAVMAEDPDESYELVPSVSEFSGLSSCTGCKSEPSIRSVDNREENLGKDCLTRFENAKSDDVSWWMDWSIAEDFDELARRRGKDSPEGSLRNHIATISADGNSIGALFNKFSKYTELAEIKAEAAKWLTYCTEIAVYNATCAVQGQDNGECVVIPHYIGGDDLLVSVTADQAWTFAIELIRSFEEVKEYYFDEISGANLRQEVKEELEILVSEISLGVGIVFSHYSYPFYECRRKAEEALSRAKQATRGKKSAICWMDLTEGGGESDYTEDKYVILYKDAADQINGVRDVPDAISKLNSSAQHNLRNQMIVWMQEHDEKVRESSTGWLEECSDYLEKWIDRTRDEEIKIDISTLEADLHRARWWPTGDGGKEESAS